MTALEILTACLWGATFTVSKLCERAGLVGWSWGLWCFGWVIIAWLIIVMVDRRRERHDG